MNNKTIFGIRVTNRKRYNAYYAKDYYREQNRLTCCSVITWLLCAKELNVHKDLVPVIAKMVWKSRKNCLFHLDGEHNEGVW